MQAKARLLPQPPEQCSTVIYMCTSTRVSLDRMRRRSVSL